MKKILSDGWRRPLPVLVGIIVGIIVIRGGGGGENSICQSRRRLFGNVVPEHIAQRGRFGDDVLRLRRLREKSQRLRPNIVRPARRDFAKAIHQIFELFNIHGDHYTTSTLVAGQ